MESAAVTSDIPANKTLVSNKKVVKGPGYQKQGQIATEERDMLDGRLSSRNMRGIHSQYHAFWNKSPYTALHAYPVSPSASAGHRTVTAR